MPTATAKPKTKPKAKPAETPDEQPITVRDVIDPDKWYSAEHLRDRLSISCVVTIGAWKRKEIRCRHQGNDGDERDMTLTGSAILRWIKSKTIPHTVTNDAKWVVRRQRRFARADEPEPEPERTVVDAACDQVETARAIDEKSMADDEREAWAHYTNIISRTDSPKKGDANELVQLMHRLGLTRDDVQSDVEVIAEVCRLTDLHVDRFKARDEMAKSCVDHQKARKQAQESERTAWRTMRRARDYHGQCSGADYEILKLARQCPRLFDQSTNPPTVRITTDDDKSQAGGET